MTNSTAKTRWTTPDVALAVACACLFVAAFWETGLALGKRWNQDANYSHGYLVPFVSLYLAFNLPKGKSKDNSSRLTGGVWLGAGLILLGLLGRTATVVIASLVAECFAMVAVIAGLMLLLGGRALMARQWAPLAFLTFAVPWPSSLYTTIAFPLQLFVSNVSAVVLQVVGIPVLHEGNLIHLPGQTMHVAEACSGLRQLTAFLAISACAALMLPRPGWYRAFILMSAIPIAVAVNALRVIGTGLVLHFGNAEWTTGWLHTAEGLLMVGVGLGLMLCEIKLIDWLLVAEPASESTASKQIGAPMATAA